MLEAATGDPGVSHAFLFARHSSERLSGRQHALLLFVIPAKAGIQFFQ